MKLDITTTYIDTITGYLHNTLNELFKLKANYVVLEAEFEELVAARGTVEQERNQLSVSLMESEKRFEELISVSGTNQKLHEEITNLTLDKARMENKLSHMDTYARQINANNETIEKLNAEITNYINLVAQLRIELAEALQPARPTAIKIIDEPVVVEKTTSKKKKITK
jgi:chromosome segregation ATPase